MSESVFGQLGRPDRIVQLSVPPLVEDQPQAERDVLVLKAGVGLQDGLAA